jgi:hypothetical protein
LSISLWLAISASAGVSLLVRRWNCDRRMEGHRNRGRAFCHAAPGTPSLAGMPAFARHPAY